MQYDAIGLSGHDLQMGMPFLKKIEQEAEFPFLSANIVNDENGELLFPAFTTVTKGNIDIAIIGVTGPITTETPSNIVIKDGQQSLKSTLAIIPKDIDLIILLSSLSREENLTIAKNHAEVHIIFEAGQSTSGKQLQVVNNTIMTHTPKEGKYIGKLFIDWQNSKTWETNNKSLVELKNEIDRLNWFKKRIEKRGGAEITYRGNAPAITEYKEKMVHMQKLKEELAKRSAPQVAPEDIAYSTFHKLLHPLKPSIVDEPQTTRILKNSRKTANILRRQKNVLKRFDQFAGSESCKTCHKEIYTAYTKTKHSIAFATLVNKSDDNNPNCVFCHVTGLPERLAYVQAQIPQRLQQVGCEACHGPAVQHNKFPKRYPLTTATESTCLSCHTEDHDDDFNYARDIELIH